MQQTCKILQEMCDIIFVICCYMSLGLSYDLLGGVIGVVVLIAIFVAIRSFLICSQIKLKR